MRNSIRVLAALSVILLTLVPAGCRAGRDTSTLPSSLRGHWITEDGSTHYYFDGAAAVMVDRGNRTDMDYAILLTDEPEASMRIEVTQPGLGGHEKLLEFSAGRDSLLETIMIGPNLDIEYSTKWIYLDGLTEPPE